MSLLGLVAFRVQEDGLLYTVQYRRKLPTKYGKMRKQSEGGQIIFVIIFVFFNDIITVFDFHYSCSHKYEKNSKTSPGK
jgi:hypothetical protein